jgi:hypothetical protein
LDPFVLQVFDYNYDVNVNGNRRRAAAKPAAG